MKDIGIEQEVIEVLGVMFHTPLGCLWTYPMTTDMCRQDMKGFLMDISEAIGESGREKNTGITSAEKKDANTEWRGVREERKDTSAK